LGEGQMLIWVRLAVAVGGALSVYLGYKFFCDLPFRRAKTVRAILLINLSFGALLATFGAGLLIADFRGMQRDAYRPQDSQVIRRKSPAREGSFTQPTADRYKNAPAGLI